MKTGPLNESELEWLDDILTKYNTDHAILDVAELDGLLTAVLSSPQEIEPEQWLVAAKGVVVVGFDAVGPLDRKSVV